MTYCPLEMTNYVLAFKPVSTVTPSPREGIKRGWLSEIAAWISLITLMSNRSITVD